MMRARLSAAVALAVVIATALAGVAMAQAPERTWQWGQPGDIPFIGYADADGDADLVIWRPSNGTWYVRRSGNGYDGDNPLTFNWGASGDVPIQPADFDGDGTTDFAVFRASTRTFYINTTQGASSDCLCVELPDGFPSLSGAQFRADDVDGDGSADLVAFQPNADTQGNSRWLVLTSSTGFDPEHASYVWWGVAGDKPSLTRISATDKADLMAYRSSGSWFSVNAAAGLPFQRVARLEDPGGAPQLVDASRWTYAPDIITQGDTLYAFRCTDHWVDAISRDQIVVSKSTDDGRTWTEPTPVLWSEPTTDPATGLWQNINQCDPSVVHFEGYYYLYSSNTVQTSLDPVDCPGLPEGCWQTYVTVSRLSDSEPLDSPMSEWRTYVEDSGGVGSWEPIPADHPKAIVVPRHVLTALPVGYGAGEQSVIVKNGQLEMFYVDDSEDPVDFTPTIDNCFRIWKLVSSNPASWNAAGATETDACGHSPVVKWDGARSRYALVGIQRAHSADARLVASYSADGVDWGAQTEVVDSAVLPDVAHNVGVEGDEVGHLVPGERPIVAWGGEAEYGIPPASGDWFIPWDLYGARLDVVSGSPPAASTQYDFTAAPNALPLSGDIDADGLTDLAAFDAAATPQWKFSTGAEAYDGGPHAIATVGAGGEIPFVARFATTTATGDDLVLYEPDSGEWRVYDNSAIDTSP